MRNTASPAERDKADRNDLNRDDLAHALRQMNVSVDADHRDLDWIYQLAQNRSNGQLSVDQIKPGHYYSNGEYGSNWSVRYVVEEPDNPQPGKDEIIYKVTAGKGRRSSGKICRSDFARWAKHEVYLNENSWQRVASPIDNVQVRPHQNTESSP